MPDNTGTNLRAAPATGMASQATPKPEDVSDLLERHGNLVQEIDKVSRRREKMKFGSAARDRLARWQGSLEFTRLQLMGQLEELGMSPQEIRNHA